VDVGAPIPHIQSAIAAATFSSTMEVVAEGSLSGASAAEKAVKSMLRSYGGCSMAIMEDADQCVFSVSINQTVDGQVYLQGSFDDYNGPLVEHCYTNPLGLDYTGERHPFDESRLL
jgi:hypothetical protein